ncbi:MAG: AsmA-like C-terminal region-containing protein, partial [Verrucomicrobiota bacterium]
RGFQLLNFHDPLTLSLAATGNLTNLQQLAAGGRLGLKDFAIRGQTVDTLAADFTYSNLTAEFFHPQVSRAQGAQVFAAEKLTLDLAGQKLIFAGGAGNMDPTVVARAIGPKTAAAMEPYRFLAIPAAQVNGVVPLRHDAEGELVTAEADLRFEIVNDTPFRWRRFETPQIRGTIHWLGDYLILTNAMAETYGGTTRGWGKFDLHTPDAGTDFSFFMSGTNADLHRMGLALWSPTNMLEGALSGEILVTSANSDDWRTWNGFGTMKLRDGLLWNVPIFGLISPALNKLSPGLGNNRATEATGRFTMTNGVIYTDSLKIHTALAQLDYLGTVDLAENVDARVTAQLMRATPLFGSLVSTVLWPVSKAFECKVTGTLGQPKPTPIYIPKLLLVPFHPIHSLEELLPSSEKPKG